MSVNTQGYDEFQSPTDTDDKYKKYEVPYSTNETHSKDEFDAEHDAAINNPESATATNCWTRSATLTPVRRCAKSSTTEHTESLSAHPNGWASLCHTASSRNQYINGRCAKAVAHRAVTEQKFPAAVIGLKGHLNQLAQLRLNLTGQLRHDAIVIADAERTHRKRQRHCSVFDADHHLLNHIACLRATNS